MRGDLSVFKLYREIDDLRRYLAAYVSGEDAEDIGARSKLWEMFGKAMCMGVLHLATTDQWVVVKVDQRTNRLMSIDSCNTRMFERHYSLMKKQDYLVQ